MRIDFKKVSRNPFIVAPTIWTIGLFGGWIHAAIICQMNECPPGTFGKISNPFAQQSISQTSSPHP